MDLVSHDKSVFILILKVNLVSYGPACLPVQGADFTDTMAWVYGRRMHMTQDCIFGCIYISFSRLGGDNCEWTSGYKVARAGGKNQPEQARKPRSCASLKVCPLRATNVAKKSQLHSQFFLHNFLLFQKYVSGWHCIGCNVPSSSYQTHIKSIKKIQTNIKQMSNKYQAGIVSDATCQAAHTGLI